MPRFVKLCVKEVEKRGTKDDSYENKSGGFITCQADWLTDVFTLIGLEADGIYRVSGNLAVIQKLRFLVDEGKFNSVIIYIFSDSFDCSLDHISIHL